MLEQEHSEPRNFRNDGDQARRKSNKQWRAEHNRAEPLAEQWDVSADALVGVRQVLQHAQVGAGPHVHFHHVLRKACVPHDDREKLTDEEYSCMSERRDGNREDSEIEEVVEFVGVVVNILVLPFVPVTMLFVFLAGIIGMFSTFVYHCFTSK